HVEHHGCGMIQSTPLNNPAAAMHIAVAASTRVNKSVPGRYWVLRWVQTLTRSLFASRNDIHQRGGNFLTP
ncbi:hypothetical protein NVV30_05800, partial [Pseudomonas syringae]|uniref:hypothetical protein n=1 Tax=Pseudomonas syringae TaxID=317 RepID=UPI00215A357C